MDRLAAFPSAGAVVSDLAHLGVAYALAFFIGWDRERQAHSAGIRTFPIVAVASCGLAMIGTSIHGASPDSYSRILQGLVTVLSLVNFLTLRFLLRLKMAPELGAPAPASPDPESGVGDGR